MLRKRRTARWSAPRCAPPGKGLASPVIRPRGLAEASGIVCTLSRTVKDAARAETQFMRVCDSRFGYLAKYILPLSKAAVAPVGPKVAPRVTAQPQWALKPDNVVPVRSEAASPSGYEGDYRSLDAARSPRARFSGTSRQSFTFDDYRCRSRSLSCATDSGQPARVVDRKTRSERLLARGAGMDGKGSSRDL